MRRTRPRLCGLMEIVYLDGHPWISFAHRNGFVAKTKPDMPMEELEQILKDAWMGD
jgi:hypothetical protein